MREPSISSTDDHLLKAVDVRHTRYLLIAMYLLAVVSGVRAVYHATESKLDLLLPIVSAICLGWWALVDARRCGHSFPTLSRPWVFLFAGLVVPGYVLWSRKWRGAGWLVLHIILWYAVAIASLIGGAFMIYGSALPPGL